jgi:hypothetical protein
MTFVHVKYGCFESFPFRKKKIFSSSRSRDFDGLIGIENDPNIVLIKHEVLLTVSCPIFPSILIAKNLLTGSLKNRSIDNLETQKKSIFMF